MLELCCLQDCQNMPNHFSVWWKTDEDVSERCHKRTDEKVPSIVFSLSVTQLHFLFTQIRAGPGTSLCSFCLRKELWTADHISLISQVLLKGQDPKER